MDIGGPVMVVQYDNRQHDRRGDHEHNAVEVRSWNVLHYKKKMTIRDERAKCGALNDRQNLRWKRQTTVFFNIN